MCTYNRDDDGGHHGEHDEGELPRAHDHDDQVEQQLYNAPEKHGHRTGGHVLERRRVGAQTAQELARLALVKEPKIFFLKREQEINQDSATKAGT